MWVEEIRLDNIRCFESRTLRFARGDRPAPWTTLLGENASGKSTVLQALALLLAGPEGATKLVPRPLGWLRDESKPGKISIRIHQGDNDPGQFGKEKVSRAFGYSFHVTGTETLTIRNKSYTEPSIQESADKRLSWLRVNAFSSEGKGWFAVGYGAFRRLTRSSQIIVPSLQAKARFTNFVTQFDESEPLSAFERWLVYLDYRVAKEKDKAARRQKERGIAAINKVLPEGVEFHSVTGEGNILFSIDGCPVPTVSLSDGYRSVLALVGDIIWRLILAFPDSKDPLREEGVVLIDELDIHLHPVWQRHIAGWLRAQFPNLQFIVATHSPLIAAGAGEDALNLRLYLQEGKVAVDEVEESVAAWNVDRILQSEAFGVLSPYSPQTQEKIDRYDRLSRKGNTHRTPAEQREHQMLLDFMKEARPIDGPPPEGSLDARIEAYLEKKLP